MTATSKKKKKCYTKTSLCHVGMDSTIIPLLGKERKDNQKFQASFDYGTKPCLKTRVTEVPHSPIPSDCKG